MHYTPYSSQVFLDKKRMKFEAFEVFKNMNLGFQMMTLLKHGSNEQSDEKKIPESDEKKIPDYLINLLFEKLELNFDRKIYCQMLKIQAFITHGTWNEELKKMWEQMATVNDFSQD